MESVYSSVSRQAVLLRVALCWLHTSLVLRQFLFEVVYFFCQFSLPPPHTHAHTVQTSLSMPYLLWSVLLCLFRFASTQRFHRFNSSLQDRVCLKWHQTKCPCFSHAQRANGKPLLYIWVQTYHRVWFGTFIHLFWFVSLMLYLMILTCTLKCCWYIFCVYNLL